MWRQLTPDDLSACMVLFEDRSFYYGTRRPDTISGPVLEALLTDQKWRQYVYGDFAALAGICPEDRYNVSGQVRFRATAGTPVAARAAMLTDFIGYAFNTLNYRKLHAHAFEFDPVGQEDLGAVGMRAEAVMREHVYKSARYFDVVVYGLCREDREGEE